MGVNPAYILNDKLVMELAKSKVEIITFDKDNPIIGASHLSNWEIRDMTYHSYNFPHASEGVFEQSFAIHNRLNVPFVLEIRSIFDWGAGPKNGSILLQESIGVDGRYFYYN